MKKFDRQHESGNVLFLILIAVALFAALSYAVTQSSRSGAGTADGETALINSAQITQYPAAIRTSIVRMIIGGTDVTQLEFNPPPFTGATAGARVFHPNDGGATFQTAPPDVMANGLPGTWHFNGHVEIENIGVDNAATSTVGNDIIAFLPGVTDTLCGRINDELGIDDSTVANITAGADISAAYNADMDHTYTFPADGADVQLGTATTTTALIGQPFGCFKNNDGENVYYHVLVER